MVDWNSVPVALKIRQHKSVLKFNEFEHICIAESRGRYSRCRHRFKVQDFINHEFVYDFCVDKHAVSISQLVLP